VISQSYINLTSSTWTCAVYFGPPCMLSRTCGPTRDSCRTQHSVNHRPLICFRYISFWVNVEDSTLSVGVHFPRSRPSGSVVFCRWSQSTSRSLKTRIRYVAVSNELEQLSFALYRDVNVNMCFVNETAVLQVVNRHIPTGRAKKQVPTALSINRIKTGQRS